MKPQFTTDMSFSGKDDGSIDFESVLRVWRKPEKESSQPVAKFIEGGRIYG